MAPKSAMRGRTAHRVKKKVRFNCLGSSTPSKKYHVFDIKGRFVELEKKVADAEALQNGLDTQLRLLGELTLSDTLSEMRRMDGYKATLTAMKYN